MTNSPTPAWRDQIGQLRYLAVKVARVHGPTHPDMATLSEVIATLSNSPADDHAAHAALGRRLHELTSGFHPWAGACGSVQQLFQGLAAVAAVLPSTSAASEHA